MLQIDSVSVSYGKKQTLEKVSFSLMPEQITVLLGRNGCGKSTLLSCLTGGVKYTGTIRLEGTDIASMGAGERAKKYAVLPQVLPKVSFTVRELVAMGRNPYLDLGMQPTQEDWKQIEQAIVWAGLENFGNKRLDQLSGGERQKAYLAMVLAQDTELVVLDEPTTYLDIVSEAEFYELLLKLKEQYKKTILIVMHDLTKAVQLADQIVILDQGRIQLSDTTAACVKSGCIERIFGVKKGTLLQDEKAYVTYYR